MQSLPIVELRDASKSYGPVQALRAVTLACNPGEIHAILGENGAGKSTMMKLLTGVIRPTSGAMAVDGQTVALQGPRDASQRGIVCIFQELSLMPALSVGDNIVLARPQTRMGVMQRSAYDEARACLHRIGADHIALDRTVSELTLAERQLVEIAKALYQKPRLLILDEATSALGADAVERVFAVIRELREEGCGILFISHRFHEVHALADVISVFRNGAHIRTFPAGTIDHGDIVSLMIGQSLERLFPPPPPLPASDTPPLLSLSQVGWENELHDVSFDVLPGEIFGLGGLDGQGQQRVLEAIFGLLSRVSGEVQIDGKIYSGRNPARSKSREICLAFIPEDRKTEGLIPGLSISDNLRLAALGSRLGPELDPGDQARIAAILDRLELAYGKMDDAVATLSGGNQQKVLLAKWLVLSPRCLLLLDPTRGIDVKTKAQIYTLLAELAAEGMAIVLQSTDYEELVHLCHRVAVFYQGRIARQLSGESLTPEMLISAAMGLASDHTTGEVA
ncbi:MAG: sugar ABC transporter ATP-binding protein [Rhodospirillaceae bacterium]|nr:sugar ABC transporter ATP-binding protein [Rhodospirillaceae bacterium]